VGRYWQRAGNKTIGDLLQAFDEAGWAIDNPPKYYRVRCPCGAHMRWIHLTPSGTNYARNALKWLERQPCMKEGAK
jgi:hypothetical protein